MGSTSSIGGPAVGTSLHETASSSIGGKRLDESIISNRHNAAQGVSMGEVDHLEVVRSENEWQDGERIRRSVGVFDCRPAEKDVPTHARSRGHRVCVEIGVVCRASLRHASSLFSPSVWPRPPRPTNLPSSTATQHTLTTTTQHTRCPPGASATSTTPMRFTL